MTQLEKDIKHIITCWLDYNRLNYQWKVSEVSVKTPGPAGWTSHLQIELHSTNHNPYDLEEEWELHNEYNSLRYTELSHSQQDKITHISDIAFPIIFYQVLRVVSEADERMEKHGGK